MYSYFYRRSEQFFHPLMQRHWLIIVYNLLPSIYKSKASLWVGLNKGVEGPTESRPMWLIITFLALDGKLHHSVQAFEELLCSSWRLCCGILNAFGWTCKSPVCLLISQMPFTLLLPLSLSSFSLIPLTMSSSQTTVLMSRTVFCYIYRHS